MPIRKSIFNRAVVMRRVHDLVEIDAGDTPIYDEQARDAGESAAGPRAVRRAPISCPAHTASSKRC
jgi:hypothetical protein